MGKDKKYSRRNSLCIHEGEELDINLEEDFCTLWEDGAAKEETNMTNQEQESLKLTEDSWISFQDEDPDSMIDCFDIEEMTIMLGSEQQCENDLKQENTSVSQDSSGSVVEDCPSLGESIDVCTDQIVEENQQSMIKQLSADRKPSRSLSPPRKRHAPNKNSFKSSKTTKAAAFNSSHSISTTTSHHSATYQNANQFDDQYQTLMRNLAVSMRRTEMTRAQVVKIQRGFQRSPKENSNNSSLSAFFSGSRSTLTNGLEQSRLQLQGYMSQMKQCNMMF
mmetsp:Transcript_22922/g.22023  ORF Transcript_22922/g.22023 Transcript_22922/m.22023 type:complete len:278 (-) Transcript_22922:21-854(-)|eukprot:CAMPEP_0197832372 /NCGR_PEP_ID=MMETSP1437-20131217/14478_1 /TAXON_ID=49252 ORGANISM="Eucampia antarctica, Strain CCMP1452" /NCGR_SAMPLE_ID=MMETSP1437 /ASSEMBLY_ACC=CAM_ASM_001096 /LENGTH=277 /DNA_ID=CAMNT_0043435723 /DNA_START=124 /DNA_END=957 /DNA_ORIENTATION=-